LVINGLLDLNLLTRLSPYRHRLGNNRTVKWILQSMKTITHRACSSILRRFFDNFKRPHPKLCNMIVL